MNLNYNNKQKKSSHTLPLDIGNA